MIYLDCPFNEKDECKELGGKWDPERKKWYIPDGTPSEKFEKWIVNISEAQLTEHEISNVALLPWGRNEPGALDALL